MDIKSTMPKFGFGHRKTNHIIIDRDGELWIAMAPMAVGGFLPMGMTSLPGTLKIEPLEDGKPVSFTYTATVSGLELTAENGTKIRIVIDEEANAIRLAGNGSVRLNGVEPAAFMTTLETENGAVISTGAARYFITARKGSFIFDDTWVLNQFHSVTPVIEPKLEDGEFELCVYDCPADTKPCEITKTIEECAVRSEEDFKAFIGELVDIPDEWRDVKEKAAYVIWLNQRVLDGENEVTVLNKYNDKTTGSKLMAIASFAFRDRARAVKMMTEYPAEMPGYAAIAAERLIDSEMLNDSRGEIYRVYAMLEEISRMCQKERRLECDALSYYAYRFECGRKKSPSFFKVGEPVLAPDLNTYLVIAEEVLGKLARLEYDDGIARKWENNAKTLKTALISELWNGEAFIGKNAYTGEASEPDEFLSLVPIMLGGRLPAEIISKLTAKLDTETADSAEGLMLIMGLYDAGEETAAKEIALNALSKARKDGVKCPFFGAALLALAHKVL